MSKEPEKPKPAFPPLAPRPLFRDLTREEIAARDGRPMTSSQRAACAFAATQIEASGKPKAEVVAIVKETIAKIEKGGARKAPKRRKASKAAACAKAPSSNRKPGK